MNTYPEQFEKTNIYHYPADIQVEVNLSCRSKHDFMLSCMVNSMSVAIAAMVKARAAKNEK